MIASKIAAAGLLLAFLSGSALSGQSLVEISKKEKERRESLKGKSSTIVTNADLAKTKKKPAAISPAQEGKPAAEGAAPDKAAAVPAAAATPDSSSPEAKAEQARRYEEKRLEIEGRLKSAQELVSLLKLKMTALQQQFYNFNNTTSRDKIQREISETSLKLQSAQADEAKVKDELDKLVLAGPAAFASIK